MVEGRDRRHDHRAHLRGLNQQAQMPEMERRFPHAQNQRAALFEDNVRRAGQQTIGIAVNNSGKRFHLARQYRHAGGLKRPRRDTGGDIARIMDHIRQRLYFP